MDNMRRGSTTFIDKKRHSREIDVSKPFDVLRKKHKYISEQVLDSNSEYKVLETSKEVINCSMVHAKNAVESRYGFSEKIEKLRQEMIVEQKEFKELEEKIKAGAGLSLGVKLLERVKSDKYGQVSQVLDRYMHQKFPSASEGYKGEWHDLKQKFDASQKEKNESIKNLEKEESTCQKQYTDLLLGLYKTFSIVDSAKQLEDKKFRHEVFVAATAFLNNGTVNVGNGFGELIKNLTKAVLEGKL